MGIVNVCVRVCVVCVCVTSSRWWHGGHEVAGEDQQFFRLVGPPLVRTTLLPHPLGNLELAVESVYPYSLYSGYGGRSTWRALTVSWPTKQDPGSSLGPALHPY